MGGIGRWRVQCAMVAALALGWPLASVGQVLIESTFEGSDDGWATSLHACSAVNRPPPSSDSLGLTDCSQVDMRWVCGTRPSTLERERARAHHIGELK